MFTIQDIHSDEALRRREFPVAEKEVFLANAAVCTLPMRVAQAMSDYVLDATKGDQEVRFPLRIMAETRQLAADVLNCAREDIALVGPTSVGLSLIANGLDFERGQNVVFAPDDYPSNAVVWMALKERGVELRTIEPEEPGNITPADVEAKIDGNTKLVALSSAHFITGHRLDADAIGKLLHERGILFSLDAIQTVGALETPVEYVDFLPADGHKWMLGPCSAGVLYVSKRGREVLKPTLLGWHNVVCPDFVTPDELRLKADARRYEAGSHNLAGVIGLHAALGMLQELGAGEIERAVLDNTRHIRDRVREKGYTLAGTDEARLSGITSFRKDDVDLHALHQKLTDNGVTASLRCMRDRRYWIRFSPHFFNTRAELDRAIALL